MMRLREECQPTVVTLSERLHDVGVTVEDIFISQVRTLDMTLQDLGDSADDEDREIVERLKVCLDEVDEALRGAIDVLGRL